MSAETLLTGFALVIIAYFTLWNTLQFVMGVVATQAVLRYRRQRTPRDLALSRRLASPPLVSVIMPACNEALTIAESVRAVLALDYEALEVVVVNDGSRDDTLDVLQRTFRLLHAPVAVPQPLRSAPVRGIYRSADHPALIVIDKHNGGSKSDAANAGINAASGVLILVIDADTMLEPDALRRATLPFLDDPATVAVGGYVGIANGCRVEGARVTEAAMPRSWLARFQVVEYMRSFLLFRIACAWGNGVSLISGAFGLFRRDAVIEVGGYDVTAIGEDMDLTLRLQAFYRSRGRPIRIGFAPYQYCWTQAPEDFASLAGQRTRWRRGLLQVLWRHRRMIGNPRHGSVGIAVLPYTLIFEGLGPLLEFTGYVVTTLAAILGLLDWRHYAVMLAASILFGTAVSLLAVVLNDVATRRYQRGRDLAVLVAAALIENVGYRQLNTWWGGRGTWQTIAGKQGWGTMKRRAFNA